MKRSDIDELLNKIKQKANKNNAQELLSSLNDVYNVKPVTTLFFNVKSLLLCELGRYGEAIDLLLGMVNKSIPQKEYIESLRILKKAYKALNNKTMYNKYNCYECYLKNIYDGNEKSLNELQKFKNELQKSEEDYLNSIEKTVVDEKLAEVYFESMNITEATILNAVEVKYDNKALYDVAKNLSFETNCCFLLEHLLYSSETFIVILDQENSSRNLVIVDALKRLNQKVYAIMPPVKAEIKNKEIISDTTSITMSNLEIVEQGIIKVRPIELYYEGNKVGNNTNLVLDEIAKGTESKFCFLIGKGTFFTEINGKPESTKRVQRLSDFRGDFFEKFNAFGYCGDYTAYISRIYGFDVKEQIDKPSECEFSIVIPARNSVRTLKSTLKTCLEQRGMDDGDYEIVVSDNSNPDYKEIEKLVKKIDSPRIRYYRTPRNLLLGRSFEFAFLKAKGEFVFSIGSDDAVLPWGLEVLRQVLKSTEDYDVVEWDRGFFVWPDNINQPTQIGQFNIPRLYLKNKITVTPINTVEMLFQTLNSPDTMYGMPMLYINSGFRRRYLKKLLQQTGRLWDGMSQDIYMGVANLAINKTIPFLQYPITIAGMSSSSEGVKANTGSDNSDDVAKNYMVWSSAGTIVPCGEGMKMLQIGSDFANLYSSFFRLMNADQSGKLKLIASKIDWHNVFKKVADRFTVDDLQFEKNLMALRYSAYQNGNDFGKWFDENVIQNALIQKHITYITQKDYPEGFLSETGTLQLDARKFDVKNVYEASKLFEKICNL